MSCPCLTTHPSIFSSDMSAKSVLFVCTGNTCRSPMAEALLRKAVQKRDDVTVSSAGVGALPGQPASRETQDILSLREAPLDAFQSRQVDELLLAEADLIVAMTSSHAALVRQFFPDCSNSVKLLGDFIDDGEFAGLDVPDPIGMGREAYEEVAKVVEQAIPGILQRLDDLGS